MIPRVILLSLFFSSSVYGSCGSSDNKKLKHLAQPYQKDIRQASLKYKVEEKLIYSVIAVESCFKAKAVSSKGAQGLMQLMPKTAERFSGKRRLTNKENIHAGTRYIRLLSKRYKGNLTLTLAAYNAGEGTVEKYKGVPPYKETQNYVRKVKKLYHKLNSSSKKVGELKQAEEENQVQWINDHNKKRRNKSKQVLCHLGGISDGNENLAKYLACRSGL